MSLWERGKEKKTKTGKIADEVGPWKKRSIFFELPYWEHLLIRHNLNVIHIEKNICESLIGTLLNIEGKTKDMLKARLDLVDLNIKKDLHPIKDDKGRILLPPSRPSLSDSEKNELLEMLASIKVPDGYAANIARCVKITEGKVYGLKSHDYHILMQ